jgi:hypothetical protein
MVLFSALSSRFLHKLAFFMRKIGQALSKILLFFAEKKESLRFFEIKIIKTY